MHIIYAVPTCSDKVYRKLFSHVKLKPAFPAHKYHRVLIEGLAANVRVDVVGCPPVNRGVMDKAFIRLEPETEGGAHYHYIPAVRNPLIKALFVSVGTFVGTLKRAKKGSVVIVDCLNRTAALCGQLAARLRGCRCVGIVTDLPDMLEGSGFSIKLANYVIDHCTDYVLLTEAMNHRLNPKGKPYVVLEGHCDVSMAEKEPALDKKTAPRSCMYAGAISEKYGLRNLIDGFRMADVPNARLDLYGPCDFEEELVQLAQEDERIFYGGLLLNSEIVEREQAATLLINPRPTTEEFVKYSFPSKNMEYMVSGTPVMTTVLPGMPKEYYPHVYLLEDESAAGIAECLKQVLAHTDEELFQKGLDARKFVLETRNNVVQAKKILDMLK